MPVDPGVAGAGASRHGDTVTETRATSAGVSFQSPFDRRIVNLPLNNGKPLSRGFLQQRDAQVQPGRSMGLRFLYNPEQINLEYQLDTSTYPPYAQPLTATPVAPPVIPGSATLSFSLVFDRTYDCWGPRKRGEGPDGPSHAGIAHDIRHLEKMLGYTADFPFLTVVAMQVFFGAAGLRYFGYITSMSVLYSTWTQDMRPTRGGVSLSMAILPYGTNDASSAVNGTSDTYQAATPAAAPAKAKGNGRKRGDLTARYPLGTP